MHETLTVDAFLRRAREQDPSGLGALLESFRPLLMRVASKHLGTGLRRRMSESDIVQETMLSASEHFAEFRGSTPEELRGWLIEVLKSRIADGLRRHLTAEKRCALRDRSGLSESLLDRGRSPSALVSLNEESRRLLDAVLQLDDRNRKILVMRYFEQRGFESIAQELNLSLVTVWRQWQAAVDQLKKQLSR